MVSNALCDVGNSSKQKRINYFNYDFMYKTRQKFSHPNVRKVTILVTTTIHITIIILKLREEDCNVFLHFFLFIIINKCIFNLLNMNCFNDFN